MANTAAQELWDEGKCFACIQINSNFIVMLLALLNRGLIASGGNAMTAQQLMTAGSCFACIPDMTQGEAMTLAAMNALIAAIEAGGGGGGSGVGFVFGAYGGGPPTFTPSGSTGAAIDTDTNNEWHYYSGAWH